MALLLTNLQNPCLVIGLSVESLKMIKHLVDESFVVECISHTSDSELLKQLADLGVHYSEKSYCSSLLENASCVMCFTQEHDIIEQIIKDTQLDSLPLYIEGDTARSTLSHRPTVQYRQTSITIKEDEPSRGQSLDRGEVYLVGAGPGDPDLLTFKALKLMQKAEIVLYDRLVSEPVLALVNSSAEKIYVGKRRQDHALPQMAINQKLLELAQQGKKVLRLKGGDPFIFGRGGEEIDLLGEHNITFQVVPGITAASGCSAYSGIPLTHRDYAQSVRFITGHTKTDTVNLNWHHFTDSNETLVFYMGLVHLEQICEQLIKCGRAMTTPAALIEKGTTDRQKIVAATLTDLPRLVREAELKAPTLLIIGDVVKLHKKLNWFVHE